MDGNQTIVCHQHASNQSLTEETPSYVKYLPWLISGSASTAI